MAVVLADIANNAGVKLGGFGDQLDASGQVTTAQLTANADRISQAINTKYPIIRKQIYKDFVATKTPFRETLKFAQLNGELIQNDKDITSITVSSGVVTVTTDEVHGYTTGDTRFFKRIQGTLVTSLNNTTKTLTVIDTTSFTLDSTTGTDSWVHTADTGVSSEAPEVGRWLFAFNLPSDYHAMFKHTTEAVRPAMPYASAGAIRDEYSFQTILNRDGNGIILLTDNVFNPISNVTTTNSIAYIEYVIDQEDFDLFSPELTECIAMLLAAELAPIVGRNLEVRQQLLAEYKTVTVPDCKRNIQSQFNTAARTVPNYLGGRTGSLHNRGFHGHHGAHGVIR